LVKISNHANLLLLLGLSELWGTLSFRYYALFPELKYSAKALAQKRYATTT